MWFAFVSKILYEFPVAINSKSMVKVPYFTGFLIIIGFIPENRKIGASMIKIKRKAKQNPWIVFSHKNRYWNSGFSFL